VLSVSENLGQSTLAGVPIWPLYLPELTAMQAPDAIDVPETVPSYPGTHLQPAADWVISSASEWVGHDLHDWVPTWPLNLPAGHAVQALPLDFQPSTHKQSEMAEDPAGLLECSGHSVHEPVPVVDL
jgi:hypothetical protein